MWIGNESNQRALANKVHSAFSLHGIVTESRVSKRKITFDKIRERLFLPQIGNAWRNLHSFYSGRFPNYPSVKTIDVENINSDSVYEFSKDADLILVSGTSLVKEKLLSLKPKIGILNLHTGLSPYVKGGPNCTNWCIANNEFHLIGNTIMWIDAGIDSGNILTTEFTPLAGNEDLNQIHVKVMEHAHDLYLRAAKFVCEGKMHSVSQKEIAKGKTFYTKDWNYGKKKQLVGNLKNLSNSVKSDQIAAYRDKIRVVKL